MLEFCQTHGLRTVPLYYRGPFNFVSVQEIVDSVLEIKYDTGELAEGIVWRPVREMYSPTLQGRLSFKTINNNYLLKHNL